MGKAGFSNLTGLSGKIGPMIAYVRKDGKQLFRSYTKPVDPRTPKQLAHRAKFALVNKALAPLNKTIQRGYPHAANAYRRLVGKAFREAITGEYPRFAIDFSKIEIAAGPLQLPAKTRFRVDPLLEKAFFRWDTALSAPSQPGHDNDRLYIVCFNGDKPAEVKTVQCGTRSSGNTSIDLPPEWLPHSLHFWAYFSSRDLQDNSNSIYLTQE